MFIFSSIKERSDKHRRGEQRGKGIFDFEPDRLAPESDLLALLGRVSDSGFRISVKQVFTIRAVRRIDGVGERNPEGRNDQYPSQWHPPGKTR